MARCFHGMPGWCAVCNGTVRPPLEGHPYARPDDEPRFAKGRDSAKWVGMGQSIKAEAHAGARACAAAGSSRMLPPANSWWHREVTLRESAKPSAPKPLDRAQLSLLARVLAHMP